MVKSVSFFEVVFTSLLFLSPGVESFGEIKLKRVPRHRSTSSHGMFFAEEAAPQDETPSSTPPDRNSEIDVMVQENTPAVQLIISDSEGFLNAAGSFLVDSF